MLKPFLIIKFDINKVGIVTSYRRSVKPQILHTITKRVIPFSTYVYATYQSCGVVVVCMSCDNNTPHLEHVTTLVYTVVCASRLFISKSCIGLCAQVVAASA